MLKIARIGDWLGMCELMLYGVPLPINLELYVLILEHGHKSEKLHILLGFQRLKMLFDRVCIAYSFDKPDGIIGITEARLFEKLIYGLGKHFKDEVKFCMQRIGYNYIMCMFRFCSHFFT